MAQGDSEPSSRAAELNEFGHLDIRSEREGATHTVALTGELDLAVADRVDRELQRVETTDADLIVLDLSGLSFMDSTGVRLLVTAQARSRTDRNRLRVRTGGPRVQRVLTLTGLDAILAFTD